MVLTAVDMDQQYLESLKEIGRRMGETRNDSDRMFLLSLLPALKQLSPFDNMDFRVEVQEMLREKLRRHAALEVDVITIPSTSSASPADLVAVVHQPSQYNTLYEIQKMPY
jgi:hypothetical protein